MDKHNLYNVIQSSILALSIFITACGGGSDSQTIDSNPEPELGLGPVPQELVNAPQLALWKSNMDQYGHQLGETLMTYTTELQLSSSEARNNVYYDGQRIFFQISDYLGESEPWNTYAQQAEVIYRDYYAEPTYIVQGERRFPHGLYQDFVRNNDLQSRGGVTSLKDKPPFSNSSQQGIQQVKWWQEGFSRPMAYALESFIQTERLGEPRSDEVNWFIRMAFNHIHEWVTYEFEGTNPDYPPRVAPFMIGLTAEALIEFYEWEVEQGNDPSAMKWPTSRYDNTPITIPEKLRIIADHLMVATVRDGPNIGLPMWIENYNSTGFGCFRYEDAEISGTGTKPAPTLNLLIAHLYSWLFKHYGEVKYLEVGDKIFAGGVVLTGNTLGYSGKFFNQNYRLSFNFIKWRAKGIDLHYQ